ncbi:MAG: HAMP domain-containing protein [Xylophilus ampelinus]
MNIRHRIVLLVALVFATIALIGGYAVYQSRSNSHEVRLVTDQVVPSTLKSTELMVRLKEVQIAALGLVAAPDAEAARQLLDELNARKDGLQQSLDEQLRQADSEAQRGLIREARQSLVNYFDAINETARFKLAGQKEMAEAYLAATVDQYLREQGQMIEAVQVEKRRSKDAAIEALKRRMASTGATLVGISAVAALCLGGVGLLLYRQVIDPISEMERKMTEIAASQDFAQRLPVVREDEIGRSIRAFNAMVGKIEERTALVRQKAADIHAMLHGIPQGFLTVEPAGTVHPEYSDHLRAILETGDIAGRPVLEAVFADADLGDDARAQLAATLQAAIGEDAMNFAFNAHLLPSETVLRMPDGRAKSVDLTWAPIVDEQDTVLRMMLCLRDTTELRALARAASAQKRELELIGEVLAVQCEKFDAFARGASGLLDDGERAIGEAGDAAAAAAAGTVDLLFRNLHTIKGNARTYGLRHLADRVHRAEQRCEALRAGEAGWSAAEAARDIAGVRAVLDEYVRVHAVKLGRAGPGRDDPEQFVRLPRQDVRALLQRLDAADATDGDALREAARAVRRALRAAGTERLADMLQGVIDGLPALAEELGKEPPRLVFDDRGLRLHGRYGRTLRDAFVHLLRNAMDHGIEPPLERIARGKPAAGGIRLAARVGDDGRLVLELSDDGRGLDLAAIRERALQRGLLGADDAPDEQAVAELIFAPGFSTAAAVTQVSGRGVGMDAVRGFVEAEGGSVALALGGASGAAARPFVVRLSLPAEAVVRTDDAREAVDA